MDSNLTRRRFLSLGVGLAGLLLVAACSGSDRKSSSAVTNPAPPDQQVLRLRLVGEPKTIDPHLSNINTETTLTKSLFSGLFTYDEQLKVVPNLAVELPTVDNGGLSKDGLSYTVELKK